MPAERKLPDATVLARLRRQGWTQRQIADTYGVTQSAVHQALAAAGVQSNVYTYKDVLPWDVASEHRTVAIMDRFRAIVKQQKGVALRPEEERVLAEWLRDLNDNQLVVDYHKDAPPNSASKKGGFFYTEKRATDSWIIREPDLS